MTEADYEKFNRHQRLAVFLVVVGPDAAADVLKHFGEADVETIVREMSALSIIPSAVQKLALEEFSAVVAQSVTSALGGMPYTQRTLEIAKGNRKASAIIGRFAPPATPVEVVDEISEMDGRQIFNLVRYEQPQTIAFVLSYLEPGKSAEVFSLIDPELRDEIIERLGTIESTSLALAGKIARNLGRHNDSKGRPALHRSGGVLAVANLLNQIDKDASRNLLSKLEERNAALGAAVRKKLFSFEDLNRLPGSGLQRILREVDSANLALSMKGASEALRSKIYAAISKRAAESLREEVDMLGSVRRRDIEAAQDSVIQIVRRLEEEGQLSIESDNDAAMVA